MMSLFACVILMAVMSAAWVAKLWLIWLPAVFLLALLVPLSQLSKWTLPPFRHGRGSKRLRAAATQPRR